MARSARPGSRSALPVIEKLKNNAWGEFESESDTLLVGKANGVEIHREVTVYVRADPEEAVAE